MTRGTVYPSPKSVLVMLIYAYISDAAMASQAFSATATFLSLLNLDDPSPCLFVYWIEP